MSKIVVKNIEINNNLTIVDGCVQLILKSEEEIMDYIEYLTCPNIDPRSEDARERFSQQSLPPPNPSALYNPPSPQEAMRIINTQFPKRKPYSFCQSDILLQEI